MGAYKDIHLYNRKNTLNYTDKVLSFVRWSAGEKLVIISNFDANEMHNFQLKIPSDIIEKWKLMPGKYQFKDQLYNKAEFTLEVNQTNAILEITLDPLESFILKLQ